MYNFFFFSRRKLFFSSTLVKYLLRCMKNILCLSDEIQVYQKILTLIFYMIISHCGHAWSKKDKCMAVQYCSTAQNGGTINYGRLYQNSSKIIKQIFAPRDYPLTDQIHTKLTSSFDQNDLSNEITKKRKNRFLFIFKKDLQ